MVGANAPPVAERSSVPELMRGGGGGGTGARDALFYLGAGMVAFVGFGALLYGSQRRPETSDWKPTPVPPTTFQTKNVENRSEKDSASAEKKDEAAPSPTSSLLQREPWTILPENDSRVFFNGSKHALLVSKIAFGDDGEFDLTPTPVGDVFQFFYLLQHRSEGAAMYRARDLNIMIDEAQRRWKITTVHDDEPLFAVQAICAVQLRAGREVRTFWTCHAGVLSDVQQHLLEFPKMSKDNKNSNGEEKNSDVEEKNSDGEEKNNECEEKNKQSTSRTTTMPISAGKEGFTESESKQDKAAEESLVTTAARSTAQSAAVTETALNSEKVATAHDITISTHYVDLYVTPSDKSFYGPGFGRLVARLFYSE